MLERHAFLWRQRHGALRHVIVMRRAAGRNRRQARYLGASVSFRLPIQQARISGARTSAERAVAKAENILASSVWLNRRTADNCVSWLQRSEKCTGTCPAKLSKVIAWSQAPSASAVIRECRASWSCRHTAKGYVDRPGSGGSDGAFSSRVRAAQLTVTNIADSGVGSLRAAIQTANANGNSTDAIVFALGSNQTIILTSSLPPILGNLTVDGSSSPNLIINGNNASSVFFVAGGAVTIKDVSIANAFAQGGQGGTGSTGGGGGLGAGAATSSTPGRPPSST